MSEDDKRGAPITQLGYSQGVANTGPDSDAPTAIHPPQTAQLDNRKADVHRQRLEELVRRATLTSDPPPVAPQAAVSSVRLARERRHTSPPAAPGAVNNPSVQPGSIAPMSAPYGSLSARVANLSLALMVGLGAMLGGLAALHFDRVLNPPDADANCPATGLPTTPNAAAILEPKFATHSPAVQRQPTTRELQLGVPLLTDEAEHQSTRRRSPAVAHELGTNANLLPARTQSGRRTAKTGPSDTGTPKVSGANDAAHSRNTPEAASSQAQPASPQENVALGSDPHATTASAAASWLPTPYPAEACADPFRVQIPTQLHPRVNPLMTSGQVFTKP